MTRRLRIELNIPEQMRAELLSANEAAERSLNKSVHPDWIHSAEWFDSSAPAWQCPDCKALWDPDNRTAWAPAPPP